MSDQPIAPGAGGDKPDPAKDPKAAETKKIKASPTEIQVSLGLLGVAGVVISLVFTLGFEGVMKLSGIPATLVWGLVVLSIALLIFSGLFGGWGMSRPFKPGPGNPFDNQAKCLLGGLVLLPIALSAAAFGVNSPEETLAEKIASLQTEIEYLKTQPHPELTRLIVEVAALQEDFDKLDLERRLSDLEAERDESLDEPSPE